jgi:Subtilase family
LTLAASALGQSFEKIGPAFYPMGANGNSKTTAAEVSVDGEAVEIGWRAHFGFDAKVAEDADSDGDGVSDAEEARQWTNPLGNDADTKTLTPDQRRLAAMERYFTAPISIDGKPATPAEVLAKEEQEGIELSRSLRASAEQAKVRAEHWSKRTGQPIRQGGKGQPGRVVIDAEGDRPIAWVDDLAASNDFAFIPPLWPGGAVGSNVTGYVGQIGGVSVRKNCGMWESSVPRQTHFELAGRISIGDNTVFDATNFHSTFVAGIIAASGEDAGFKGGACGCKITAYGSAFNFSEITALTNATVKDMRASNHSYGKNNGWDTIFEGGHNYFYWTGDLATANAATNWEDYHFGLYNAEAATADTTALNKPYHLLVKSAGNERGSYGHPANGYNGYIHVDVLDTGKRLYNWIHANFGNSIVLLQQGTGKYIPLGGVVYPDYQTSGLEIKFNSSILTLPFLPVLSADGNSTYAYGGYDSLAEGFSVAKNTLSVGAMGPDNIVADFSSAGPTDDGRLKPDVVALGVLPTGLGAASDSDYSPPLGTTNQRTFNGTSFAAPAVAGAVTLLSQYQENLRTGKEPLRASTFKALLCHTAQDDYLDGPDFRVGWGRVNAEAAAEMIKTNTQRRKITEVFLDNGQAALAKVRSIGGQPIKVTISWNDPAGAVQPNVVDPPGNNGALKVLKNDINLILVKTSPLPEITNYPYQPDPAHPDLPANFGVNNRDTVEQVFIENPTANQDYEIRIQQQAGTTLTGGGQWVSVVMSGLTTVMPAELSIQSINWQTYYGGAIQCNVVFSSVLGGYYKVQYVPFGAPANSWQDIPGGGIINSRADLCYVSFYLMPSNQVPVRVIAVSPNPFGLP